MEKYDYFEKLIRDALLKPEILKNIKTGEDKNKIYTVFGYIEKRKRGLDGTLYRN